MTQRPRLYSRPPYRIQVDAYQRLRLMAADGVEVAEVGGHNQTEVAANAHLFRGAPLLLEACEGLAEWLGFFRDNGVQIGNLDMGIADRLRVAVAAARGEAQQLSGRPAPDRRVPLMANDLGGMDAHSGSADYPALDRAEDAVPAPDLSKPLPTSRRPRVKRK